MKKHRSRNMPTVRGYTMFSSRSQRQYNGSKSDHYGDDDNVVAKLALVGLWCLFLIVGCIVTM